MVDTDSSGTEGGDNDYGEATGVLHTWDLVQWVACRWCMRVTLKRVQALRQLRRLAHLVVLRRLDGLVPVGLGVLRFLGTPRDQMMGPLAAGKGLAPRPALWSPLWWQWGDAVRPRWAAEVEINRGLPTGSPQSWFRGDANADNRNAAWERWWTEAPAGGAADERAPRALALHLAAASLAQRPIAGVEGGQVGVRVAGQGGGSAGGGTRWW